MKIFLEISLTLYCLKYQNGHARFQNLERDTKYCVCVCDHFGAVGIKVRISPSKKIYFICFNESPLKIIEILFISSQKLFSFSRYVNFCLEFLIM